MNICQQWPVFEVPVVPHGIEKLNTLFGALTPERAMALNLPRRGSFKAQLVVENSSQLVSRKTIGMRVNNT